MMRRMTMAIVASWLSLAPAIAPAASLRIGLQEDPDALDPASGSFFVGRVVFAAMCDRLIDIDAAQNFVPQLATDWTWSPDNRSLTVKLRSSVEFQDGEKLDAAAVKVNLDRYRTRAVHSG